MANEFKVRKGLIVQGSGSNIFDVQGSQGQLFSITDSLSGSLFSVNDISGIPIMEVFSDNTIKLGTFNNEAIIVSGSRTGMGIATPQAKLHISGASNSGLFEIDSPAVNNIIYVSGSGRVGIGTNNPTNTLQVVGGVTATSFTGSLFGTSSWAVNAQTASFLPVGTYSITSSWATNALTASNITPSITNNTDNRVLTATGGGTINGESNLTFDGSVLTVTGRANISTFLTASIISASSGITASQYSGVPTFTYNDNTFQGVNIRNISNTSNALNGLTIYSASNDAVGQFNYINPVYANSALRDTVLFNSIGDRKLGFVANSSTAAGANSDIYFQAGSTTAGRMIYISGQAGAVGVGMGASTPTSTNRLQVRGQGATSATTALRVENSAATARLTILDDGTSAFNTSHLYVSSSGDVGIGTTTPTAELHISGASNSNLLRVGSPTNSDIFFVNGNGRVGINTTSSTSFLGGNISTFTIFQNSGSGDGLTPSTGLQIVNSGSSTSAQAQLSIVTVGDKFAAFNIGTSGSGTQNNYWHLSKRNAAASHALNLYNNNNGTFSSNPLFSFIAGGTSTLGENFQIYIDDANDRVGLQTPPTDTIHLSTDVGGGSYIRIDATSVQAPPVNLASAKSGFGIIANDYFLAEPDYWMEIKLDANVVLIPCYLPA